MLGLALVASGCAADSPDTGKTPSTSQGTSAESITDRLGKSCDDDTMGVTQGKTTIWCDPSDKASTLVWVDKPGHAKAEKVKAEAAAKKRAEEQKAADELAQKEADQKEADARAAKEKADKEAADKRAAQERQRQQEEQQRKQEEQRRQAAEASRQAEQRRQQEQQQQQQQPQGGNVYYKNCTAVRDAGAAPIHAGEPGYARHLDRDGDGVGCE